MDQLNLFGLISVTAMVVFYSLEYRSRWFVLGFAFSCVAGSLYGFLQGAWPFGAVELIWSAIAVRRWAKLSISKKAEVIGSTPVEKWLNKAEVISSTSVETPVEKWLSKQESNLSPNTSSF